MDSNDRTGSTGEYELRELNRRAVRALSLPLEPGFGVPALREGQRKLAQAAATQGLRVPEQPLFALHADPLTSAQNEWRWQLLLPVSGKAQGDEDITIELVHGGTFVESMTTGGLADLPNLYDYFLRRLLPHRKHQLTRPCIYHRVVDGIECDDSAKLAIAVFMPVVLSIKRPPKVAPEDR